MGMHRIRKRRKEALADNKLTSFLRNMFRIGTPECAISFAVIAMALAVLFLLVGFWQTLLILGLMLIGAFLGGVKDKKKWFQGIINKLFPPKNSIPYREKNPELEKAVRESLETKDETKARE